MDEPTLAVRDDRENSRYVVTVDDVAAGATYYRADEAVVTFTHTEVDPAFEGRGVGSRLAAAALDDVRGQGKRVRPLCPFIAAYIARHDEYADLVTG